jgi:probable F420-dependent oxidoreductase
VKFHVLLPGCMDMPAVSQPWETALTGSDVLDIARAADASGFEGLLLPEHFAVSTGHADTTGRHFLDATTAQAVLAGATSRVNLGSMVTLLPLHNPVVLAKSLATMDWFSGGRAAITTGLGWQREEYDAVGVPWAGRGARADEYLAAMFELWHSATPAFDGEYVSFSDVVFEPKPVRRPHPTVWIGGDADAALRRAARFGDGWAPWLTQPNEIPAKLERLQSLPGFDGRPFAVFYSLMALRIGLDETGHVPRHGEETESTAETQRVIDACAGLAELGVTDTWVPAPTVSGLAEYLEWQSWLAEEVVASFTESATATSSGTAR